MSYALNDWECESCQVVEERLEERDVTLVLCRRCGGQAHRIVSFGRTVVSDNAAWLPSVIEVVSKTDPHPIVARFRKYPTRENYKAWMKHAGVRPLEDGEKFKRPELDIKQHVDKIMEMRYERRRIEI